MIASIDIGTSYSGICILGPDGKAQPVDISTGASMFGSKYSLPSAVFVDENGDVLVGQAAMNSRKHKPQNFRMEFKRNLGEEIPILLGERSFRPEELYTELFRHMKARAEKVSNESIKKVYLTYPASYGEKRREKLRAAAKAAGLFDLELVDEPTSAAMCYCAEGYIKDGQTLLVYDFGGGTFDVSLIRYQGGRYELLSEPVGLERCGGMDIDYLIAQDMRQAIEQELPGSWDKLQENPSRFLRFTSQINELAVKAKHHLSDASCFEEYIEMGMDDVPYRVTVERFNEMVAPLVGQTLQTCRRALDEAGVSASDVSAVLMVGGTSRVPLVQEMARRITGKPALCAADLELIVAQGALMYSAYQNKEQNHQKANAHKKVPSASLQTDPKESAVETIQRLTEIFSECYGEPEDLQYVREHLKPELIVDLADQPKEQSTAYLFMGMRAQAQGRQADACEYFSHFFDDFKEIEDKVRADAMFVQRNAWSFLSGGAKFFYPETVGFESRAQIANQVFQQNVLPIFLYDPSFLGSFAGGFAVYPDCFAYRTDVSVKKIPFTKIGLSGLQADDTYLTLGSGLYIKVKCGKLLAQTMNRFRTAILISRLSAWDF